MYLTIDEHKRNEYFNHWVFVNFLAYPMGRPKPLGIRKMLDIKEAIWRDDSFWVPLIRLGIERETPEQMAHVDPEQYDGVMELMSAGMVKAAGLL